MQVHITLFFGKEAGTFIKAGAFIRIRTNTFYFALIHLLIHLLIYYFKVS